MCMSGFEKKAAFKTLIVLLPLIFVNSTAYAFMADAINPTVVDVRSCGMGNTGSVSAQGSNAIFFNPALLLDADYLEMEIGGRLYWGFGQEEVLEEQYYTKYNTIPQFTHVSLALPIQIAEYAVLYPAFGYHLHIDNAVNREIDWEFENGSYKMTDTATGGLRVITPAIAMSILDHYSIGLAFSFSALEKLKSSYYEVSVYDDLEIEDEDTTGIYYETRIRYKSNFSSTGTFFTVGAFAEPFPQLGVSFVYRSPIAWGWRWGHETLSGSLITKDYIYGWDTVGIQLKQEIDDSTAYMLPGMFTVGLRSKILPFLNLSGEFQTRFFTAVKALGSRLGVNDGSTFRFGAEFVSPVIVRGGFYFDAIPQADSGQHTPKYLKGVTAGIGIPISSVVLINGSFEYATWSKKFGLEEDLYTEKFYRFGASLKFLFPYAS